MLHNYMYVYNIPNHSQTITDYHRLSQTITVMVTLLYCTLETLYNGQLCDREKWPLQRTAAKENCTVLINTYVFVN